MVQRGDTRSPLSTSSAGLGDISIRSTELGADIEVTEAGGFQSISSRLTRRRFMRMAILTTSVVVLPVPRLWAKGGSNGHCLGCAPGTSLDQADGWESSAMIRVQAPPKGDWNSVGYPSLSHFSSSPRKGFIIVHHAGIPNSHENTDPCTACNDPGDHTYDFCIDRQGDFCDTGRWRQEVGAHALGCNRCSVGIMLQGCFGGCDSGNVLRPSDDQLCTLAFLSLHLKTPSRLIRHRPHARCFHWKCGCSSCQATHTDCCGTNLINHNRKSHWNRRGERLMRKMLKYRRNLLKGCNCFTCPQ